MARYVLGLDFGSLSVRAAVVNAENGETARSAERNYEHGFIEGVFPPTGEKLPDGWTLQQPRDWLGAASDAIRAVNADGVYAVGLDFTAPTILPVTADGTPLCFLDEFKNEKHAYAKKWKHSSAVREAERINETADRRLLRYYGGRLSSEMTLPKIWQTLGGAPRVYAAAHRFADAGDWMAERFCGVPVCSKATAGYKALWNGDYPTKEFFRALDPRLENVAEKLMPPNAAPCDRVGTVTAKAAEFFGLPEGIPVACPMIDAHAALPAAGVADCGTLLAIIGTSSCQITLCEKLSEVPGILAVVKDGIIPGSCAYEAGQTCVGDCFAWFTKNCVPEEYARAAREKGEGMHEYLTGKAERLRAGENGLVALDWWNGNRSVLLDGDLSGLIAGLTVQTRPEEIYRALLESTAYGMRVITDNFEKHGVPVERIRACGGIAVKNPLMMQIYADVLRREICVVDEPYVGARGSAIYAAAAAGLYPDLKAAICAMSCKKEKLYRPDPQSSRVYDLLYAEYLKLYELFGRNDEMMKRLKKIKGLAGN